MSQGANESKESFVNIQEQIVSSIRSGKSLLGKDGALTPLIKYALEQALEGELDEHLLQSKVEGKSNRRNGKVSKKVKSEIGSFELESSRERIGDFEPKIVKKRQTVLSESLDERILSLFSSGMGYRDISNQIRELYDYEVSTGTVSKVTDRLLPVISEWRNRPLDRKYAIVFFDAMFFKLREDGVVKQKAVYNVLGINLNGQKELLGFYLDETEGAKFWMSVLSDLRERGVEDILISCMDGLKGFPDAVSAIFPKTTVQLCVVHQIRNSLKYISHKYQKEFMTDLKKVYQASNKDIAESALLELDEKWGDRYSIVLKSWNKNWEHLSQYFQFSKEVRKLIYTTNPIEGFHRQVRKYTKSKAAFSSKNALYKLLYCAIKNIEKKWTQPIRNWGETISQLDIAFPERL